MKVTERMIELACREWYQNDTACITGNCRMGMQAALEAVFNLIEKEADFRCIFCGKEGCAVCGRPPLEKESAAKEQPDNEGWIKWKSGTCPVDEDILVETKGINQDGSVLFTYPAPARFVLWGSSTLMAYRILPNQTPEKLDEATRCAKRIERWENDRKTNINSMMPCPNRVQETDQIKENKILSDSELIREVVNVCARLEVRIAQLEAKCHKSEKETIANIWINT